jgi:hypothetical protein
MWILTLASLFLFTVIPNAAIAAADQYPASVTVTAATGDDVIPITVTGSPLTPSSGAVTFTAAPTVSNITGYNSGDYEFRFTFTGQETPGALPSGATYTTQPTAASWEHVITFPQTYEASTTVALTIYYVKKVPITVTPGTGVATGTITPQGSGAAGTAGTFTFTAAPNTDYSAAFTYNWKITVTNQSGTAVTSGITSLKLGAGSALTGTSGVYTVAVANASTATFTIVLDYSTLSTATVTALNVALTVEEVPVSITLTPSDISGAVIAATDAYKDGSSNPISTQGKFVFTLTPAATIPATEPEDPNEPKFAFEKAAGGALEAANTPTAEYTYTNGEKYTVTVTGIKEATKITVSYPAKKTVTLTEATYSPDVNEVTTVTGSPANATRGTATVAVGVTAGLGNGYEWYFTKTGTPATIYGANSTPKVVGAYNGATSTVTVSDVTEAATIDVAYVQTPTVAVVRAATDQGIKTVDPIGTRVTGTFKFTFKATISDDYAAEGNVFVYPAESATALTENVDYTVTPESDGRVLAFTIPNASPGANRYAVKYEGLLLAPTTATYNVTTTSTANANPITIYNGTGKIVDGKITFTVKPTVPRALTSTGGTQAVNTGTGAITTAGEYAGTTIKTTLPSGAATTLSGNPEYYISAANESMIDTFIISNISDDNVQIEVHYDAPPITLTYTAVEVDPVADALVTASGTTPVPSTGVVRFSVALTAKALAHEEGGTFSYIFSTGTANTDTYKVLDYPIATEELTYAATGTYRVTVTGLRYATNVTVGYDTVPAKVVEAEPKKPFTVVEENDVEAALEQADEGTLIPITKPTANLGAAPTELDNFTSKGSIVPGEKLATTIAITDETVIGNDKQDVVLTFTGALAILPPLTVENVWITSTSFKIVYVFDSSSSTRSRSLKDASASSATRAAQTRADEEEAWTEYDAKNKILYVHIVGIDITVIGGDESYAQLAVKKGQEVKNVGTAVTAVTLYDNPYQLIPDNGVPGTNYPGYFTLEGNYPTDGQLRYKVGDDAAFKPFYGSITNQEIERLANGEYLYFGLAIHPDLVELYGDDAVGVPNALFIYVPKTYATSGDNPVAVARPYSIEAATTNTVELSFSRTSGSTNTGTFDFIVTPAQVIPNGELTATFTKKGGGTVNPLPEFVPGKPDSNGAYNVTVKNIKVSDIVVTVEYKQGVNVTKVHTSKVWSYGKTLFISSTNTGVAKVYNLTGQLVKTVDVNAGVNITELTTKGVFLVQTNDNVHKVVIEK